jgi:hypothetical protein
MQRHGVVSFRVDVVKRAAVVPQVSRFGRV